MARRFGRVAVVNRGEAAVRVIRAIREWNAEHGDVRLESIALYTEPDRSAPFVREADCVHALGSAWSVDAEGRRRSRYLDYDVLAEALVATRAEAAWVGWGFVAEHAEFAELCRRLGVVFIGPSPEVMRRLGDKIGSKREAEAAGVPVAPWSGGPVGDLDEAHAGAERLGYPLMVKATAGGGGRGIRRVRAAHELKDAFESARSEAAKSFGDPTVFLERLVEGARHIEVQILGDSHGTVWALGVRDCTVQRRNQKVIEESPSPALTEAQHREVLDAAARLGQRVGYEGAGTVEFLYDEESKRFSFMEVNARLQVEHPVTEATTGLDLVKLQLHVALGGRLEGDPPAPRGHAIEVRVNAEDPERAFAPSPGLIAWLRLPGGPGLRVDSGFTEGDVIAPEFDSMIAKVIALGADRAEALARLRRALGELAVVVRGGTTNRGFLLGLLERPEIASGAVDVGWLDRLAAEDAHLPRAHAQAALVQGAIDAYEAEHAIELSQFQSSAARGRPRWRAEVGRDVELRHRGARYAFRVFQLGPRDWEIEIDGVAIEARVERLGPFERRLEIAGRSYRALSHRQGLDQLVEVDGVPHRLSRDDAGIVRSPTSAVVLSLSVRVGDAVAAGDRVAVLEAMKTEVSVLAPFSGRVREILASPNVQVDAGAALLVLEAEASGDEAAGSVTPLAFDALATARRADATPEAHCRRHLEALRRLVLGFDVDPRALRQLAEEHRTLCAQIAPDAPELLRGEDEILAIFADVCGLFRRRGVSEADAPDERGAEEYFLAYLRSLDPGAAALPLAFLDQLRRVLAHYGVDVLDRSPALEEALLWICKAHQRADDQAALVLTVLERRLDQQARLAPHLGEPFRALLERIGAVARGRHQAVSDLAHEVAYQFFDRPFFDRIRDGVYAEADATLARLAAATPDERAACIEKLVECPEPLVGVHCQRLEQLAPELQPDVVEVMLRRYYRIRELERVRARIESGLPIATAEYEHEGRRIHVVASCASRKRLAEAASALAPLVAAVPAGEDVVLDFYLALDAPHEPEETVAERLCTELAALAFARPVRRLVAVLSAPGAARGMGGMQHFTFRRDPASGELREDRLYRGLHAMMGKRLQIWRLGNFEMQRLPSAEDLYLYRGVARANPRDERLFAFAEVRDVTPIRDESTGRVVRIPKLEMMWMEALAGIRRFQSRRSARDRLQWSRVFLYVWPPVEIGADEWSELAHRLAPAALDLGLEKVVVRARLREADGSLRDVVVHVSSPVGRGVRLRVTEPSDAPLRPLDDYTQKVVRMRQRGLTYPWEIVRVLAPPREVGDTGFPPGDFVEHDLDESGERLVAVDRPPGRNEANLIVGVVRNYTAKVPEGMKRVLLMGDPSRELGAFAEPECRRIIAAIGLAERERLPIDWLALSAGAKIAMDSGTENLDWTAAALRRIVQFTQDGGEINVVISDINVGGQSYWNAEATMLMHTRGILVMTPEGAMVLTGKRALEYSGGVSAEDNQGIGGYERIMGPNGEAQYFAADIEEALRILLRHHEHTYVVSGERFPRRAPTDDPADRDVRAHPHGGEASGFALVGDIFSDERNPGRHKPFAIRRVMQAVIDRDHAPLERWADMRHAEIAVIWDAHLGGWPVCLVGIESQAVPRLGFAPADGPDSWTPGTLFPMSSKKVARAINAASGNRPVVILANLSGFDGSPESLRRLQLEHGAEIGRAVVNFRGPIVFCGICRYHGGAYVVFSKRLSDSLEAAALEGSYASVIGGAPAAAVVFASEVERRARTDSRLLAFEQEIAEADESRRGRLRARWHELFEKIRLEKLGEVAEHFDSVHSVERAQRVGSLDVLVPPARLRPYLIDAVERGIERELRRGPGDACAKR